MQNQYEEVIKLNPLIDRQKALDFIKKIHLEWLPQRNMIVNGLTITFFANGEHEFGRLSNASLRFAEQFGFRDKNVESWHVYFRDEPEENTDLTASSEKWRGKWTLEAHHHDRDTHTLK